MVEPGVEPVDKEVDTLESGRNEESQNGTPSPEEVTEITYDIVEKSLYPPTRALFVGNLTSPFDNSQIQGMLEDNVADSGSFIERAWLNQKRTHSIVVVSDIAGAELLREKLNGKNFPDFEKEEDTKGNDTEPEKKVGKPLYIDFIPVKVVQSWIEQEEDGPRDALWKVEYETIRERVIAKHIITNHSNIDQKSSNYLIDKRGRNHTRYNRDSRYYRGYNGYNSRGSSGYRDYRPPRSDYSSRYSRDGNSDYKLSSSSYVPKAENDTRSGSRETQRYRGGSGYSSYSHDGYRRGGGGYYDSRDYYYDDRSRVRRDGYYPRYSQRGGYRSERPNRNRPEQPQDTEKKTDDRDRSRSPVRPSDMDWDLEGEH